MQDLNKELQQLFNNRKWQQLAKKSATAQSTEIGSLYFGISQIELGNVDKGIITLKKHTESKQVTFKDLAYFYIGQGYQKKNQVSLADEWYEKATVADKKNIKYLIYRVVNLFNNKMFYEIKSLSKEILEKHEDFPAFSLILMTSYEETDSGTEAPESLLDICKNFAIKDKDYNSIGKYINFLIQRKNHKKIKEFAEQLESNDFSEPIKFYADGKIAEEEGNLELAEEKYRQGLKKFNILNAKSLVEILTFNSKTEQIEENIKVWFNTEKNNPDFLNLAGTFFSKTPEKIQESIEIFRECLKKTDRDDIKFNFSFPLLAKGMFDEGWQYYQARENSVFKRKFEAQRWNGKPLSRNEKIMVWSEQGVGDHIAFSTMLPDLVREVGTERVIFETDPRLISLFQRSFPEIEVRKNPRLKVDSSPYITDYQKHIAVGSLASIFRRKIEDFPGTPSLKASDEWNFFWKKRLNSNKIKIGIAWTSGLRSITRDISYLSIEDLGILFKGTEDHIDWINLQYGDCDNELEYVRAKFGIKVLNWDDINLKDDFEAVAALINNLDLVISISSNLLELAGALGKPTWGITHFPNWTMHDQDHYPWHHSVRMYQVAFPYPIKLTLPEIAEDLKSWLNTKELPPCKSRVIIDLEKAKKQLEKFVEKTENNHSLLSEAEAEQELLMGKKIQEIKEKSISIRLERKIDAILKHPDQYSSLITLEPRPNLGGNIEEIKQSLAIQGLEDLSFEINEILKVGAKTLILSFQGNVSFALPFTFVTPYFYPTFAWTKIASKIDNISMLQIRDSWQMWYQVGPLGSCLLTPEKAIDKWLELIMPKIEQSKAEKIICVGTSAGASAAIQFGAKLNADAVVAISPQARPLDEEWEIENGGVSVFGAEGNWRKKIQDKFSIPKLDLEPYAKNLGEKLHIVIPKLNHSDIAHSDYLTRNNQNINVYRSSGKDHGDVNKELILDIIKKLI